MAFKTFVVFASALCLQSVLGQYISSGSVVSGNSVVDNNVIIGNSGYGLANSGYGLANSGSGLANSGSGLANSGYGLANSGYGLANSGLSLANSGLGFGTSNAGIIGSGASSLAGAGILAGGANELAGLTVGSSGPLIVTSISPIGPSGLAVASENTLEGVLTVTGQLPYLSAVAFEGSLPTAGSGVATCGCGSGNVGIVSEGLSGTANSGNRRMLY